MEIQVLSFLMLLFCVSTFEFFLERTKKNVIIFRRELALVVIVLLVVCTVIFISPLETFMQFRGTISNTETLVFNHHWGYFFSLVQILVFSLGVLLSPRVPVVRVKMSRVYLLQALLLFLSLTTNITSFMLVGISTYLLLSASVGAHVISFTDDVRKVLRVKTFFKYHCITVLGLFFALFDHLVLSEPGKNFSLFGLAMVTLSSFTALGLFPFHGWVLPFFGAPRSTIFLPIFCIEASLLVFFRLYVPLAIDNQMLLHIGVVCSLIGLFYATILFFGENKLKRIPGYLYGCHISLMVLGVDGLGLEGQMASILDSVNLLLASCGLLAVNALLTGRYGVQGVLSPRGLVSNFPELGICYLLSALSLVGFPGTLGFIQEELIIEAGLAHHYLIIGIIALAFTLNGFSCFRLFARIFYGQRSETVDKDMALSYRERFAICMMLFALICVGLLPGMIFKIMDVSL